MSILTTITNQKTHIIYGVIILVLASAVYHFFSKTPSEIIKTVTKVVTKVQTVEKVVNRDKIVYIDKTITTHKKNGDVIVEVDKSHSDTKTNSDTKSKTDTQTILTKTEVEKFMKNYSIEALYPLPLTNLIPGKGNPIDTQISLGMRLFSTPLWVVTGVNVRLNQLLVGSRVEF